MSLSLLFVVVLMIQVPTYKSDATFAFISAWIKNEDYPIYNKDCMSPEFHRMEEVVSVQPE